MIILLSALCAVSATNLAFVDDRDEAPNPVGIGNFLDKLGIKNHPKLDALREAGQAATAALEKQAELAKSRLLSEAYKLVEKAKDNLRAEYDMNSFEALSGEEMDEMDEKYGEAILDFGDQMEACDKQDCRHRYFVNETIRWIKRALKDMGVFAHENPKASAALFIGASILIANSVSGGALVPMALEAIGFGSRGPIAGSIASVVQKKLGSIAVGSTFAQLQSAAMGGASMIELQKIANLAFAGLSIAGGTGLLGASRQPFGQAADFEPVEWRRWEAESRTAYSTEMGNNMDRLWRPLKAENCIAYGYREYRAQVWFVPDGADPVEVCLRTPAVIKGIGFKTPLGCADEGPKKGVIGTWYVQSNETRCTPQWSMFEDEGCMQYGRRRIFSRLIGLRRQDDWNTVCESTPARIGEREFDGPTYCEDKGIRGIYGVFDIADGKCECYCAGG